MSRETDIAWAAGLFEGEGCITNRNNSVSLRLVSTDLDVVEKFQRIMDFGKIGKQLPSLGHNKILYHTSLGGPRCERALFAMTPYFGERRRARAVTALLDLAWKHPLIECDACGKILTRHYPTQHYCSRKCMNTLRREKAKAA